MDLDRRTILKTTGAAGVASLLPAGGASGAVGSAARLDDAFDLSGDALQEALVVLAPGTDAGVLEQFDLAEGYYAMDEIGVAYTKATPDQLREVAALAGVRYVEKNKQLEWHNGDAAKATHADNRTDTGVSGVQDSFDLGYTGEGVHVAVVDSGVDAYHPDLQDRIRHNFRFVDPLSEDTMWVDLGNTADSDDIGHGSHCCGSIAGEGNEQSYHEGMAPGADLTVYSSGATLSILQAAGAYYHILHELTAEDGLDEELHLVSNSYGSAGPGDFNPAGSLETATWNAYEAGILPLFSAGNSGPGLNTLNAYGKAPHVVCVAASHDGQGGSSSKDDTLRPTDFSSRGRPASYTGGEGARWPELGANDRGTALSNLWTFHHPPQEREKLGSPIEKSFTAGPGLDAGDIAGAPTYGDSTYVEYTPQHEDAAYVDVTIDWTPQGQDLDIYLHEGAKDGPVIASAASGSQPETLQTSVEQGTTYWFEVNPWADVTASGTISIQEEGASSVGGPYGVYRPTVIAPGYQVVSTMGASALKALSPTYGGDPTENGVYYASLSGTSMSCPVTTGCTALLYEAYYRNNGGRWPTPDEAIRYLESTAVDTERVYTPYNAGAGFVDILRAVRMAEYEAPPAYEEIDLTGVGDEPVFLDVAGSRTDDGQVHEPGKTNQVDITVSALSHDASEVYDVVPSNWTVDERYGDVVTTNDRGDGTTEVHFGRLDANEVTSDSSVEFTYFVEAPESEEDANQYPFGPVEVVVAGTEDNDTAVGESTAVTVPGTGSTEYVAGANQSQLPL